MINLRGIKKAYCRRCKTVIKIGVKKPFGIIAYCECLRFGINCEKYD